MNNVSLREFRFQTGAGETFSNVISSISETTTPAEFDITCSQSPGFQLNCRGRIGFTALSAAALYGNIAIIEHIVRIGEESLFLIATDAGITALHAASRCVNKELGFLAAKKLLQLGSPVNIVNEGDHNKLTHNMCLAHTPLDDAVNNNIEVAKLLLRHGGISVYSFASLETLKQAKKEMVAKELLFAKPCRDHELPWEVINYIFIISLELDLKD